VLDNVGTLIAFRVSAADAELLAPEFHPLPAPELVEQSPYRARLRRLDDEHRVAFIEPRLFRSHNRRDHVVRQSRRNFARSRHYVEKAAA
jgi:hypothetical protein